jgi:hypothetical protein
MHDILISRSEKSTGIGSERKSDKEEIKSNTEITVANENSCFQGSRRGIALWDQIRRSVW